MGWWKVHGTDTTIGDESLDVLGGAVAAVVEQYRATFGRRPTVMEWEALLQAVLGSEEEEQRAIDSGVVRRVQLES